MTPTIQQKNIIKILFFNDTDNNLLIFIIEKMFKGIIEIMKKVSINTLI